MKTLYYYVFVILIFLFYGHSAYSEEDWQNAVKTEMVNKHIELNAVPFSIPFQKIYPGFSRAKISLKVNDHATQGLDVFVIYNEIKPRDNLLYNNIEELVKFLVRRHGLKLKEKKDVEKYITPIISITEIKEVSRNEYHLFTGKTFFDSRSGYILKTTIDGEVKSVSEKLELGPK